MPEIKLLDQSTINQIAAGEVVGRPSSVVKELLENAMDAKATAVTVEIKNGGIDLIRITDNGCGIEGDQVAMAFKRHATSKLRGIDDLQEISSLGFRGEALASIAAVSQVELITKTASSLLGICYCIEDGEEKSVTQIGAPEGTTILVRNLFSHVPARKKFLKTAATEGNYIAQLVEEMAMQRPDISLRFINNGQNKLYTSGNGRLKDLIYAIYGREISANLLEVSASRDLFSVTGYIGKPIISRGNRSFENYYINGRFIKNKTIAAAIEQAYKPFMMQHRYPFTAIHIKIKPELVDVNVHPSKMEIRLQNEQEIFKELAEVLESTLYGKEFIPDMDESGEAKRETLPKKLPEAFERRRLEATQQIIPPPPLEKKTHMPPQGTHNKISYDFHGSALQDSSLAKEPVGSVCEPGISEDGTIKKADTEDFKTEGGIHKRIGQQETLFNDKFLAKSSRVKIRIIGQLFETYWLMQYENSLYIMDQHAAHEKVNYERLMASYKKRERISQLISPPMIVSLTSQEQAILEEYMDIFVQMGYTIEPYGGREYAISEVPANLYGVDERDLFIEMLSSLTDRGNLSASDLVAQKLASMSCKAAIKGNQRVSLEEAQTLIDELMTLENPYACPHGRPTIITMSKYELEKKFKRIV